MAMYTPDGMHARDREVIGYDRSATWIVILILIILFVVFFGFVLL